MTSQATETYHWEGVNPKGKPAQGDVSAQTPALAQAELQRQGIIVKKITKKSPSFFNISQKKQPKIKTVDILLFTRQLATMLDAGLPIIKAFEIIGTKHENASMEVLILSIKNDMSSGLSFAESLAKHPKYFDNLFCNLIGAGERSGTLDVMLGRIATYLEKSETLKKKIKKAAMYPTVVFTAAMGASAVLLLFVVPRFQAMFSSFGADLPGFTQMVVNLSDFLKSYWWIILAMVGGIYFACRYGIKNSPKFALLVDKLMLHAPIIGMINQKVIIARIMRTLSTTISAGMPIIEAFDCANNVVDNRVYKNSLQKVKDEVSSGQQINTALEGSQLYPSMVIKMVAVGEESGALENMLNKIATYYEADVDGIVDNLSALMEPLIMLVLGVIIGGFVIAMYLPIFKMGSVM
jgi:type IV pilus assembly protein PilC